MTDAAARALEGLLTGTPAALRELAQYPLAQHASLRAAVREGFISALTTGGLVRSAGISMYPGRLLTFDLELRIPSRRERLPRGRRP